MNGQYYQTFARVYPRPLVTVPNDQPPRQADAPTRNTRRNAYLTTTHRTPQKTGAFGGQLLTVC